MVEVYLCCAPSAREVAGQVSERLTRNADARVEIEECGDVTQAWEGGLGGGAVVLLLSPDAVPASSGRGAWQELLRHWESNAAPAVATVVVNPCAYPRLLDRRNSFPWSEGALRQVERWVMDLEPPLPSWQPAALEWFTGREQELEQLWTRLVDVPGTCILAGNGKTALAQEFARQARHNFRELLRVDGDGRSAASLEGELARVVKDRRTLVVLEDVESIPDGLAQGRASVLATLAQGAPAPDDAIQLVGEYPAQPAGRGKRWEAALACRRNGFPMTLAAEVAGVSPEPATALIPLDIERGWYRRPRGDASDAMRARHAVALMSVYSAWEQGVAACLELLAEMETAVDFSLRADFPLSVRLVGRAGSFLRAQGRFAEAARLWRKLRRTAISRKDATVVEQCDWELSWLTDRDGGVQSPAIGGEQLTLFS